MPDIAIWNRCNNHCLMCTNPTYFQQESTEPYSLENIKNRLSGRSFDPNEPICITGGEPTTHPDFFKLLQYIRKTFPKNQIAIASNGRLFFYDKFLKNLLQYDNLKLEIAVHGYDEKSHDAVTQVRGSFQQTVLGLRNIIKQKNETQELEIRLIITKQTLKNLNKTLSFLTKELDVKKINTIVLIFMEMEGQVQDNSDQVIVTYQEVAHYIPKIIDRWAPVITDLRLYHFPLCTLPAKMWPYIYRTLRGEEVTLARRCQKCPYKKYCLGIHRDYLSTIGEAEFQPPHSTRIVTTDSFYRPIIKVMDE